MGHELPPGFIPADYWPSPGRPEGGGLRMFCERCGSRCLVEYRGTGRFSSHNGHPQVESRTYCPRRAHWWDGHHRSAWLINYRRDPRPAAAPPPPPDE